MEWSLFWTIVFQATLALLILFIPVYLFLGTVRLALFGKVKGDKGDIGYIGQTGEPGPKGDRGLHAWERDDYLSEN